MSVISFAPKQLTRTSFVSFLGTGMSVQVLGIINSFSASGDFCRLLINFANSLDPDQGPDLTQIRGLIWIKNVWHCDGISEKVNLKKESTDNKKACKITQHAIVKGFLRRLLFWTDFHTQLSVKFYRTASTWPWQVLTRQLNSNWNKHSYQIHLKYLDRHACANNGNVQSWFCLNCLQCVAQECLFLAKECVQVLVNPLKDFAFQEKCGQGNWPHST